MKGEFFEIYFTIESGYGSYIVFYDKMGNPAFEGRKFWEASSFINGKAVVQPYNASEAWDKQSADLLVIDNMGRTLVNISKKVEPIKLKHFTELKFGTYFFGTNENKSIYINAETFELEIEPPYSDPEITKIIKKLNTFRISKGFYTDINDKNNSYFKNISEDSLRKCQVFYGDKYGYLAVNTNSNNNTNSDIELYNYNGDKVDLNRSEIFWTIAKNHFVTKSVDGSLFYFKNARTLKLEFITNQIPDLIQDDYLIYGLDWESVKRVVNLKGKEIWPINKLINAKSIAEVKSNPLAVRSLHLSNITQNEIEDLPRMPALVNLNIGKSSVISLDPLFNASPNIESLHLWKNEDLINISDQHKMTNLTFLYIEDCPLLQSKLDDIVKFNSKLKTIKCDFLNLLELRKKYPTINFEEVLSAVNEK